MESNEQIVAGLVLREAHVAVLRAEQAQLLAELDARQAASAAGARSLQEWVAGALDVGAETARDLVALSRLDEQSETWRDLADGEVSVDRALAEARLARASGVDEAARRRSRGWDIAGVRGLAALRRRMTPVDEQAAHGRRYVRIQPNLDESDWRIDGSLPGIGGRIVADTVDAYADRMPTGPGGGTLGQRRADGLVAMATDAAAGGDAADGGAPVPLVASVFVDAAMAGPASGEAGAAVVGGPRVGPQALAEILCGGQVEVVVTDKGQPVAVGPRGRALPPKWRRAILARDHGRCTVAGCRSRYRLNVHHVVARSAGGNHDPANLATVCWYHHHVTIHGAGYTIDPASPPHRRTLIPP